MTERAVLFWVFTGFFVLIGIVSLMVLLGFPKTADKQLREWALRGFIVGIATAMFGLFRAMFMPDPAGAFLTVALVPPDGLTDRLILKSGKYAYDEIDDTRAVVTRTGPIVPGLSQGGWEVKLPADVSDKAVTLQLVDERGGHWLTDPFYPNYSRQVMRTGTHVEQRSASPWLPVVAVVSAAGPAEAAGQQQASLKFDNYARKTGDVNGQAFYEWRVFVDEPPDVLSRIRQVDYVLHPTFPQPYQRSTDRGSRFDLAASGWGEFRILITVHYTDGRQEKASYWLSLGKRWPIDRTPGLQVKLDTIHVEWDGSAGKTGWIFDVFLNGKATLNLPKMDYDDGRAGGGRRPSDYMPDPARRVVGSVSPGKEPVRIEVRGRRSFGGDTANGTATIDSSNSTVSVNVVNGRNPRSGSFVFRFSTARLPAAGS